MIDIAREVLAFALLVAFAVVAVRAVTDGLNALLERIRKRRRRYAVPEVTKATPASPELRQAVTDLNALLGTHAPSSAGADQCAAALRSALESNGVPVNADTVGAILTIAAIVNTHPEHAAIILAGAARLAE
jgi:hypothetical protein